MRIYQFILSCIIVFGINANAQTKKDENTLLWEITGKDLKKPSYLFGTYHFADKGFIDTMKVINEKLMAADAIVGELVMDSTLTTKLVPYMLMNDNFLDKLLSQSEYKLVADYLKKLSGYDLQIFNSLKPMAVQVTLMGFIAPITFTEENPAIDQYFQTYGIANGKNIYGLETAEEQGEILFGASIERQKELLLKSIKDEKKTKKIAQDLYKYYIIQDMGKLQSLFKADNYSSQEEMDKMLKNRNNKWIEKLPALMDNQSLFIAVGAAHLIGKDGLIKGLQAKGYTLKPIATH